MLCILLQIQLYGDHCFHILQLHECLLEDFEKMIVYIDIDETICETPKSRDYAKAMPLQENIEKANKLFEEGNTVIYWTARGTGTGIDWSDLTKSQLASWGVRYNDLKFGKPVYDLFIDDKNMNVRDWK